MSARTATTVPTQTEPGALGRPTVGATSDRSRWLAV